MTYRYDPLMWNRHGPHGHERSARSGLVRFLRQPPLMARFVRDLEILWLQVLAIGMIVLVLCGVFLSSCSPPPVPAPAAGVAVVVSCDGLRPDAAQQSTALESIRRESRWSMTAQTVSPSLTLPAHVSMVVGVDVPRHGVTWNSHRPDSQLIVPSMFALVRAKAIPTAIVAAKDKLRLLATPQGVDHLAILGDAEVVRRAVDLIDKHERRGLLMLVHFAAPDVAGHNYGWMSPDYLDAVDGCGRRVQRIHQRLKRVKRAMLLVTADHGGHGTGHGSQDLLDMTVPFYVWESGKPSSQLAGTPRVYDVAPPLLAFLGAEYPKDWDGIVR